MNDIHLALDTWIVPGQILKANPTRMPKHDYTDDYPGNYRSSGAPVKGGRGAPVKVTTAVTGHLLRGGGGHFIPPLTSGEGYA